MKLHNFFKKSTNMLGQDMRERERELLPECVFTMKLFKIKKKNQQIG